MCVQGFCALAAAAKSHGPFSKPLGQGVNCPVLSLNHEWHFQFQALLDFSSPTPVLVPATVLFSLHYHNSLFCLFILVIVIEVYFIYHKIHLPPYVYISMDLSKFTELYNHHCNPVLGHFHHLKEIPLCYL